MKRVFFLKVLVILSCSVLFAQEETLTPTDRDVPPAPVVSGLSASIEGSIVTLSWIKAPTIEGESIILRSNRPITANNYAAAEKRTTLPFSVTTYTDTLTDTQDYYYAVLSRDANGTLYEFFLPVSNSMLVPVSTPKQEIETEAVAFSNFDTITRNDAVIVTWKSSVQGKNLVLYRSTSPFTNMASLVQAIVVSSFSDMGMPYVDYPVPGVPYYYSIIDEGAISSGNTNFIAGVNTNRIPVEISSIFAYMQRTKLPNIRPMPLPFLNPSRDSPIVGWQFSTGTEKMIRTLTSSTVAKQETERSPYMFLSDIESTSGGEEYSLKKILETSFSAKSWPDSIRLLSQFLTIRRTPQTTSRTHFYLGEAYYFTGNYRKALLEFLLAEDLYYNQSREWIQYVLEKMVPLT